MKTRNIFLAAVISFVLFGTNLLASDLANVKEAQTDFSNKIENYISRRLDLTKDMDKTSATIKFKVDAEGKVIFTDVNYEDKTVENSMKVLVNALKIENSKLNEGAYFVDVKFIVR